MADRRAISPRQFAGGAYYPEQDTGREAAQQEVIDAYNAQFGPQAQWQRNYDFVLQNTRDPEKARIYADSIASTQRRQELTQLASGVAGPVGTFGREALAAVRALRGAEEAPAVMRALPPPSSLRNARTAEEMITPDVIHLPYRRPSTEYRMQDIRPTGERAGPPTQWQMEARSEARNPLIDSTYSPLGKGEFGGTVRGTVDPLDVLAGEGGPSTEAVQLAQKVARGQAENRALRLADEESRFAGGEGPNYAEDVLNRRRIAAQQEADFRANQLARMEEEGGGAGRQATINDLNRAAEADFRERQLQTWGDESGAITSGRNPPNPVSRALQVVEGRAAPSGPGTGFTMIDTPGQGFTMVNPPSRAVAMRNIGSEAAGPAATQEWASASGVPTMSFADRALRTTVAGSPFIAATTFAPSQVPGSSIPAGYNVDSGVPPAPLSAGAGRGYLTEGVGDRYASMIGAGRGIVEEQPGERAKYQAAQDALQTARERAAPPVPMRRPEGLGEQSGGLSRLFSDPYAGKSARDLYAEANRMQSAGDESGANLLMQRAGKMITKPEDLESTGMATGGAAKPHKDAALHKALDIIAHMLGRR
jgi:hypothetical protein